MILNFFYPPGAYERLFINSAKKALWLWQFALAGD